MDLKIARNTENENKIQSPKVSTERGREPLTELEKEKQVQKRTGREDTTQPAKTYAMITSRTQAMQSKSNRRKKQEKGKERCVDKGTE